MSDVQELVAGKLESHSNGGLRSALELVHSTARKAAAPQVVNLPGDGRTALVACDGELKTYDLAPAPRAHEVYQLSDLAAIAVETAKKRSDRLSATETTLPSGPPAIFFGREGAVALLDVEDRRDRVTFPLTYSRAWYEMLKLEASRPMLAQRDAIKLLRLTFDAPPQVVLAFRRIQTRLSNETSQASDRGRESLGKSIEAQVVNADDFPEELDIEVPIYINLGEDTPYRVKCLVELDAVNGQVQLVPQAGRLDFLQHHHMMDLGNRLRSLLDESPSGELVEIYYGAP